MSDIIEFSKTENRRKITYFGDEAKRMDKIERKKAYEAKEKAANEVEKYLIDKARLLEQKKIDNKYEINKLAQEQAVLKKKIRMVYDAIKAHRERKIKK